MKISDPVSIEQLRKYKEIIKTGGTSKIGEIYDDLNSRGYKYAGWAAGVARDDSLTGHSALDFLKGSAAVGIGSKACWNLTDARIDNIRHDMAIGYLDSLQEIAVNDGVAKRDVNYAETESFHGAAFEANGLSIDNWTLKTPMDFIREKGGVQAVEAVWEKLRDTGGTGPLALTYSSLLVAIVAAGRLSDEPARRQRAESWWENVVGRTFSETVDKASDLYRWIGPVLEPTAFDPGESGHAAPTPSRRRVVVVGDRTDHGGVVLTGETRDTIGGLAKARLGDLVSCPLHGENRIVEGCERHTSYGRALALEGFRTACGSTLTGSKTSYVTLEQPTSLLPALPA